MTGGGRVAASRDMREMDRGDNPVEDESLLTVGGSWQGSPSITRDRQLIVETMGMRLAGSTLWHASSIMTNGMDRGGKLSGANSRMMPNCVLGRVSTAAFLVLVFVSSSSSG